jgi:hypothetical protein
MTPRWDPAMTSILLASHRCGFARDLANQVGGDWNAHMRPRTFFSCVSRAYIVHMMNVRRLSDRFLSCVTFLSVYVVILAATS